jgi:stage II sporulation protein M
MKLRRIIDAVRRWGGLELFRASVLFGATLAIGIGFGVTSIEDAEDAKEALAFIPNVPQGPQNAPAAAPSLPAFATRLFLHNLQASALMVGTGLLASFLPLLFVAVNGLLIGYVGTAIGFLTAGPLWVFLMLLPHGIFEIPAFILAGATGARLARVAEGRGFSGRAQALGLSWPALLIVAGLLAVAATIEAANGILLARGNR